MGKLTSINKLSAKELSDKASELELDYKSTGEKNKFKSSSQKFMHKIEKSIQIMLNEEVNYTRISNSIYNIFSVKISPPTIKKFCTQFLHVPLSEKKEKRGPGADSDENAIYNNELQQTDVSASVDDSNLAM